ncbi:MAG: thioredoxin-dependent thiol peroxidase [Chitinispirillaceae bacterium]|nr:thioredoxin-dependent thiol peroxidase [Chitinispirillaceae bacterium]
MSNIKIKDSAPLFCLKDQYENEVCLNELKGNWIVLYFYPKDDTPGCTLEAKSFSEELPNFEKLNAKIIGISTDSCDSHQRFAKKHNLQITLLSDVDKKVVKEYGVWKKKKMMGKEYMGIERTSFLIDKNLKIAYIWNNVKVEGHVEEVKAKIDELESII